MLARKHLVLVLLLLVGCRSEEISVDRLPVTVENGTVINIAGETVRLAGYDKCEVGDTVGCVVFHGRTVVPVIVIDSQNIPRKEVWDVQLLDSGSMRVISRRIVYPDGLVEKQ